MKKDLKKISKALEEQGFTVKPSKSKQHLIVFKDGRRIAVFSGTPSDHRSWLNSLADARRAGFRWPPRR